VNGPIRFIALSGFLGAGKTTTMIAAAEQLRAEGNTVAVITNDQSTSLIDTALASHRIDGVDEVTGGCFCCRFEDLVDVANRLITERDVNVIIAESVGSCTDLTATVIRPMIKLHGDRFRVAPLTTVVDPLRYLRLADDLARGDKASDLAYLYRKQLEDAAVIAVNKKDLLAEDELADVVSSLAEQFPDTDVVTCSAARGDLRQLRQTWTLDHTQDSRDLRIDYDRYGVAEAKLAWLNETIELRARDSSFVPAGWIHSLLEHFATVCRANAYVVGHVKVLCQDDTTRVTKASLIDDAQEPAVDIHDLGPTASGAATINARVQCEPAELEEIVRAAVQVADAENGVESTAYGQDAFKPGQPMPTHRISVGAG